MRPLFLALLLLPPQDDDKIAPAVLQRLGAGEKVPVIILGRTQLVDPPKGFDDFCAANAKAKRLALRKDVVARLKEIARKEQADILEKLGKPEGARPLWIVNAIAVTLSPDDIRKAAALETVKYVYPGQPPPAAGDAGAVSEVLKPVERKAFTAEGRKVPWNLEKIGALRAWNELKTTGEGIVIAMLDAGVNYAHEDLRANVWINAGETANNGRDDDGNGYVDDLYGFNFEAMKAEVRATGDRQHGTWTTGIAAGDGTGGTITGVAPRARIMLLMGMSTRSAALATQYAVEHGADVINMSFSIPNLGQLRGFWRMLSDHATCAGLVCVSGCGNFQQQQKIPVQMRIPEGIPSCIGAGGLDEKLEVPNFASLGPVEWESVKFYGDHAMPKGLTKPDVCGFTGPGYPLLAAADKGYLDPNNQFRGNSFSSPHVAGVAALMLSANRDLPAWRVREIMEATATDLGDKGKDSRTGAGLANAFEAVRAAQAAGK